VARGSFGEAASTPPPRANVKALAQEAGRLYWIMVDVLLHALDALLGADSVQVQLHVQPHVLLHVLLHVQLHVQLHVLLHVLLHSVMLHVMLHVLLHDTCSCSTLISFMCCFMTPAPACLLRLRLRSGGRDHSLLAFALHILIPQNVIQSILVHFKRSRFKTHRGRDA